TTAINVDLLQINESATIIEVFNGETLDVPANPAIAVKAQVAPNPADNVINVYAGGAQVKTLKISDIHGRLVKTFDQPGNEVYVEDLNKGIYFAEITTDEGTTIQKIIKK